jgi:hypothetical protein
MVAALDLDRGLLGGSFLVFSIKALLRPAARGRPARP